MQSFHSLGGIILRKAIAGDAARRCCDCPPSLSPLKIINFIRFNITEDERHLAPEKLFEGSKKALRLQSRRFDSVPLRQTRFRKSSNFHAPREGNPAFPRRACQKIDMQCVGLNKISHCGAACGVVDPFLNINSQPVFDKAYTMTGTSRAQPHV